MDRYLLEIFIFTSIAAGLYVYFYRKKAELEIQNLKEKINSERAWLTEAQDILQNNFKSLAATALEGNNRQFIELAKQTLEKESLVAKHDLERRQQDISSMVSPLKTVLEKYQEQLNVVEKERQKSYFHVESELKKIAEISLTLSKETTALKDALKKPHIRGRWGEIQLKNCVEMAGMSEFADVTFQDTVEIDEQRLIPDMTVKMPGGHVVVVDAKTPIDAFISSLEADNVEKRQSELIRHGRHVKEHVKRLSTRAYGETLKQSADFTVMFLPNESFLYAALEVEPDLVEFAIQRKVLIATPPTLIGLLKVIRFGWNEEKLKENAQLISEAGQELHKRVCDFFETYENVGRSLEKARNEYEAGKTRLQSRVLVQAKRLEKLGAKSNKELPEMVDEEVVAAIASVETLPHIEGSTPPPSSV